MPKLAERRDLSSSTKNVFRELFHKTIIPAIKQRILDEFLYEAERGLILQGVDPAEAADVVPVKRILFVIAEQRGWSLERALLEMALASNLLDLGRYHFLRREIGEPAESENPRNHASSKHLKLKWDPEAGVLRLGDDVIRPVRVRRKPTRVQRLFEAFERHKWKKCIPNPFDNLIEESLYRFLHDVNSSLKGIQFHGRNGGNEITWSYIQQV